MAVRAIDSFEEKLAEFGDIDDQVVARARAVVRLLPVGTPLPYPIPLGDGGLVLEFDCPKQRFFADVELRTDRSVVASITGEDCRLDKFDSVSDLGFQEFLDTVVDNLR